MRWVNLIAIVAISALIFGCGSKGTEVSGEGTKINPPRLNEPDISANTPLPYQTFTGYVDVGYKVEVRGGAEIMTTDSDPLDGNFCVVVQLKTDEINHLEFYAVATNGKKSEPVAVDITQDPSLEPEAKNVALNKAAYAASLSTTYCPECTPDKAVDGSLLTFWENSVNKFTNPDALISPQWWMVNLGSEYYVKSINLKWNGDSYATKFEVWYSLLENPIEPPDEPGLLPGEEFVYWEVAYSTSYNNNVELTIDGEYLLTRWIALVLYESSNQDSISQLYKYRFIELEALGFEPGGNVPRDVGCP